MLTYAIYPTHVRVYTLSSRSSHAATNTLFISRALCWHGHGFNWHLNSNTSTSIYSILCPVRTNMHTRGNMNQLILHGDEYNYPHMHVAPAVYVFLSYVYSSCPQHHLLYALGLKWNIEFVTCADFVSKLFFVYVLHQPTIEFAVSPCPWKSAIKLA